MIKRALSILCLVFPLCPGSPRAENIKAATPSKALEAARLSAQAQDFENALEVLIPFLGGDLSDPINWEITAEAGRDAFSLGRLEQAREYLRRAVRARPTVAESAIYLEATSYLLGDRKQTLTIFEALLQAQLPDLYLAVTLPGETRFLADPDVRKLLKRYALPLDINPESGSFLDLHLGQARDEVIATLGLPPSKQQVLMARAGPELIWIFSFDSLGTLKEAVFQADKLQRYTPYELRIKAPGTSGDTLTGWHFSPRQFDKLLGGKARHSREPDGALKYQWNFAHSVLDLVFTGAPGEDGSRGHLQLIRISRPEQF